MGMEEAVSWLQTPLGWMRLSASEHGIRSIEWAATKTEEANENPHVVAAASQLAQYFDGQLKQFDLTLDAQGTDFQKTVWQALLDIPFGHTQSYLDIAKALGDPNATRAVGAANGRNPISVVVPCHRVVGSNGKLTGYAGGMRRKAYLLQLEQMGVQISMF